MRVFAISDLHVDYKENLNWVRALSLLDYKSDILVLAGDLSSNPLFMREALAAFEQRFKAVFFVPGNHDLWVTKEQKMTSIDRFLDLEKMTVELGIRCSPEAVGDYFFVPLLGWYDFSFGEPSEKIKKVWADFRMCSWPDGWTLEDVTNWFVQRNALPDSQGKEVVSFSHFLPHPNVLPAKVNPVNYFLSPVLGTTKLMQQIQHLKSRYHIFGHSHLNTRRSIPALGETTFINNAYGYPNEAQFCRKELLELIFD